MARTMYVITVSSDSAAEAVSSRMPMPDHSIQWLTLLASGTSANIAAACAPICGACCVELDIDEALQAWGVDAHAGQSSTDEPSQHGVWRAWQAGLVTPGSVQY